MTIKKVIKLFEKALLSYQQAYEEKWDKQKIIQHNMERGLCAYFYHSHNVNIYFLFKKYYKNIMGKKDYLFPRCLFRNKVRRKYIKKRLEFLKTEIVSLKKLQKKGFTHL